MSRRSNTHSLQDSTSLNKREALARYLQILKTRRIAFVACTTGALAACCVACHLSSQGVVPE